MNRRRKRRNPMGRRAAGKLPRLVCPGGCGQAESLCACDQGAVEKIPEWDRPVKRTTDDWTEKFYGAFSRDVDCHIGAFTELEGEEAYTLRRMIMISLRHGPASAHAMTEEIDRLRQALTEIDRLLGHGTDELRSGVNNIRKQVKKIMKEVL